PLGLQTAEVACDRPGVNSLQAAAIHCRSGLHSKAGPHRSNGINTLTGGTPVKKSLLGVLVIGLMTAADDKKPDDVKDKLEGTGVMVSIEFGGMKVRDDVVKGQSITFEDDKATQRDKDKVEPMTYKIDASKKPTELDMTPTEGSGKGKTAQLIFQ